MRRFFAVVVASTGLLAGCGYFGFDPIRDASAGSDASTSAMDAQSDSAVTDAGPTRPRIADVCATTAITVILDGDATDAQVGGELATAVAAACSVSPTIQMLSETTPGLLDPSTRAPLLGPAMLGVVGGDNFYQDVMGYLEMGATPVVSTQTASDWIITRRSDGATLVSRPLSTLDLTHDITVVEIIRDVPSGSVLLAAYGLYYRGTRAASYYFANVLNSTITVDGREYYVVEWTNVDADPDPSAGDTYTVLAMSP